MSREDRQRLDDIEAAIEAIHRHAQRGSLTDGLVFDAIRVRLIFPSRRSGPNVG